MTREETEADVEALSNVKLCCGQSQKLLTKSITEGIFNTEYDRLFSLGAMSPELSVRVVPGSVQGVCRGASRNRFAEWWSVRSIYDERYFATCIITGEYLPSEINLPASNEKYLRRLRPQLWHHRSFWAEHTETSSCRRKAKVSI